MYCIIKRLLFALWAQLIRFFYLCMSALISIVTIEIFYRRPALFDPHQYFWQSDKLWLKSCSCEWRIKYNPSINPYIFESDFEEDLPISFCCTTQSVWAVSSRSIGSLWNAWRQHVLGHTQRLTDPSQGRSITHQWFRGGFLQYHKHMHQLVWAETPSVSWWKVHHCQGR